jgi:flagellar biosynthetic protein FlhB
MAETAGERTEAPTPKRLQKARDDGDLLKSREFAAALGVLVGCGWLAMLGPALMGTLKEVMAAGFKFGRADVEHFEPWRPIAEAMWKLAPSLGLLFAVATLGAVLSQAGLGALGFNAKLMAPKPDRMNPASGLKRIFGATGWIELGKSLLKVVLLGAIGFWMLWQAAHATMGLASTDLHRAVGSLSGTFFAMLFAMSAGLVIIAGVDVPIQIIQRLNRLKMSKQEIRDEHKESEGSPEAKAAIKQRQREVLKRSYRKAVEGAHVVLTNPTHFSVALRYDRTNDQVPVVVAKGRGATALAIRELAGELQVPVLEYPQLARAVYYTSKEGQEVRDDLYLAIATVLAFVFGLNAQAGGTQPPIAVPPSAQFDENGERTS